MLRQKQTVRRRREAELPPSTLLTNSSILLEEDSAMAKQNQQVQPERIMVWETIIILLDFGLKQLDKEGSPDSGLPNSLYR